MDYLVFNFVLNEEGINFVILLKNENRKNLLLYAQPFVQDFFTLLEGDLLCKI